MDEKDNISKVVTNILDGRRYSMDGLGKDYPLMHGCIQALNLNVKH